MTRGNGEMQHWLWVAMEEEGVHETPGPEHTGRILEYHAITTLKASDDETPWCAAFVGWCLEQAGIRSTRSAAAKSYLQWGYELSGPVEGCIAVLERNGRHHVGFWVGQDVSRIRLFGGNQRNRVGEVGFARSSYKVTYRWPVPA